MLLALLIHNHAKNVTRRWLLLEWGRDSQRNEEVKAKEKEKYIHQTLDVSSRFLQNENWIWFTGDLFNIWKRKRLKPIHLLPLPTFNLSSGSISSFCVFKRTPRRCWCSVAMLRGLESSIKGFESNSIRSNWRDFLCWIRSSIFRYQDISPGKV